MVDRFKPLFERDSAPTSLIIESVSPAIDCGRHAAKRETGDTLDVAADIFKDGHDRLAAVLKFRKRGETAWRETPMTHIDNDRWGGSVRLSEPGAFEYTIEAFPHPWRTWLEGTTKKISAGLDIALELREGAAILETLPRSEPLIASALATIAAGGNQALIMEELQSPRLAAACLTHADRSAGATLSYPLPLWVDRQAARFAAWYELFPRSAGTKPDQSGTFQDVIGQLPRISEMGFDVLYFTPIHPIGTTKRKGKNNSVIAEPGDPGVPYAIGNAEGGHDAIEPGLGTIADFDRLVAAAKAHGLEIALDLAIQASPDHPWVKEHPEWFTIRPDGSIMFAENPPKKYEDIFPVNFSGSDWKGLWEELKRIVLFWVSHGVLTFRVDNPHTKPTIFWEWLIDEVRRVNPNVIFLSEAFTRPKVMKSLAKSGFSQSYTYFTWRHGKQELIDYFTELTQTEAAEYMRGNLFPSTHDINTWFLQTGGRAGHKLRHVLAATLSSVYGIYSGYELCESTPVPGKEEHLNSEKYEYTVRDWDKSGNIVADITRLNAIRRVHPALHEYDNLRFFWSESDQLLCYGKTTPDHSDNILIVVNLDPFNAQSGRIWFPLDDFGLEGANAIQATDLISGQSWTWHGGDQWVRLDPAVESAHIFHLEAR
ncbi:MAG: alpha-1,4-glucan--maltose-1-phosphate maltosyltransferase [Thermomicrobiales bacterium]|nr:alpha-1,4-glucan--maltose-1-phosphate maltosyltransferase [Thermomicrobiales bacterium]